jgi:hypothetical protein
MATNIPKDTWIDQVINIGIDKNIPFGVVNTVVSRSSGKMVGFIRDGKFYELGATPTKELVKKSTVAGFSIDELNKELPNGGINIAQVKDYINSDDSKLSEAARKIVALQSLGIWDMNGKPTTKSSNTNNFGKLAVSDTDIKTALENANTAKQQAAATDYKSKQTANTKAQQAGKAIPYPNLSSTPPVTKPVESISGFQATPATLTGTVETANVREGRVGATGVAGPVGSTGGTGATGTGTLVTGGVNPAGKTGSTGGTGGTGGSGKSKGSTADKAAAAAVVDAKQVSEFQGKYGVQAALINSDPSLKALFDQARKENWAADRFKAEFLNTTWSKTHAESWQAAERARLSGPGTYADSYNRMRQLIAQTAVGLGLTITPDQIGTEISSADITAGKTHDRTGNLVEWALDQSWGKGLDTTALRTHIAELGKINSSLPGGAAYDYASQLKTYAYNNGLSNLTLTGGNDYYSQAAQSILLGKSDLNTWKADILKTTKQNYSAFSAQLDAGIELRSIAAPYINTLANLLEIAPDQINLGDTTGYGKMVTDALRGSDPANPVPITLYDFEKKVKADPKWGYTNNARDTVLGGVGGLLKTLGKVS